MNKLSTKQFIFKRKTANECDLNIIVSEVTDPSYGMYVWPCSVVLAQYVWHNSNFVKNKRVLELGAGSALPGIVSAKCGSQVTLSDACSLPQCLENCRRSCQLNGLSDEEVRVARISWGQFCPDALNLGPVDIILGSDCFYDSKDFEDVLVTVAYVLRKNPHASFWTTYQVRSSNRCILPLLRKWQLKCTSIPLQSFGADGSHLAGSSLPGNHTVQMFVTLLEDNASSLLDNHVVP